MRDAIHVDLTVGEVHGRGKVRIEGERKVKKGGKGTGNVEGEKLQMFKIVS